MHAALARPAELRDRSGHAAGTRSASLRAAGVGSPPRRDLEKRGGKGRGRGRHRVSHRKEEPRNGGRVVSKRERGGRAGGRLGWIWDADRTAGCRGTGGDDDDEMYVWMDGKTYRARKDCRVSLADADRSSSLPRKSGVVQLCSKMAMAPIEYVYSLDILTVSFY